MHFPKSENRHEVFFLWAAEELLFFQIFFLPLQFLLLTNTLYATGHLAGDSKLGPAIPPVSPPSFLCTLSLLAGGMGVRSGKRVPCQLLRGKHWAFGGTADPAAGWCQGGFVLSSFLKVWADNTSLKEHRLKCFVKVLSILKYLQWTAVKNRVYANCGYSINLVSHVLQHLFM